MSDIFTPTANALKFEDRIKDEDRLRCVDLAVFRGKLDVKRQFTVLAASPQKLACRYDGRTLKRALAH